MLPSPPSMSQSFSEPVPYTVTSTSTSQFLLPPQGDSERTGKHEVLQFTGPHRVRHDLATEQQLPKKVSR